MKELLRIEGLYKTFQKDKQSIQAVKNVSFSLYPGECLGIIGESGSGKSTVANIIAGLEKADSGKIMMQTQNVPETDLLNPVSRQRYRECRKRMQMVFQNPRLSFNPAMTIGKSMAEAVHYYTQMSQQEREERIRTNLERVGLTEDYARKKSSEMSGGECQRAAIARALMIEPELLICDEVTSALDVSIQAQVMGILTKIKEETRMSMLFISHDLALVSTICDRIAVMYHGEIVEIGETENIIQKSTQEYTRSLIQAIL